MSVLPLTVVHPEPYGRHVIELWEYQWNAARLTYERVCYQPLQIMEPRGNPIDNIAGMYMYPGHRIRVEDMEPKLRERMRPVPPPDHHHLFLGAEG